MRARLAIVAAVAIAACGGDDSSESNTAIDVDAIRDGRTIVAQVNGEPVFADCVETQAAAKGLSARDALSECIDFELLAQEAQARGYAGHAAVREARKTEAVRALIDHGFEATHAGPGDIPQQEVVALWKEPAIHTRYNHPEYRWVLYARGEVAENEPDDSEVSKRARAAMDALYQQLAGRVINRNQFAAAIDDVRATFPDVRISNETRSLSAPRKGRMHETFARAMFSIREVQTVSEPTRTPWGWDVVFLQKIAPLRGTRMREVEDELRAMAFEPWRKRAFLEWSKQLAEGTTIDVDVPALERLAADPSASAGGLAIP